ncbi:HD domain-containing protein, partial [Patescibacteria group bacterium]|nr:HD domain-containing protein [Patescibacteria group bacterium]
VKIKTHQNLTIKEDLSRREFTINAMAIDLINHQLIDHFGGIKDLKQKVIKCVGDPHTRLVLEDPTRMLRALRFASKYNFRVDSKIIDIIKKHHNEINKTFTQKYTDKHGQPKTRTIERVSREILALEFLKGFDANPVMMIELLDSTNLYQTILPAEMVQIWEQAKKTPQPKNYHSEGSVWNHSMLALKNIAKLKNNSLSIPEHTSINLKLAAFLHDFGKVTTIKTDATKKYTYYNHPDESAQIAQKFIKHLKLFSPVAKDDPLSVSSKKVTFLIKHHMLPSASYAKEMKDKTIVKYFLQDPALGQELLQLAFIDASSSIKASGRQDYTGISRTLQKIQLAKAKLALMNKKKVIYPVDGNKIKKLLVKFIKDNPSILTKAENHELLNIARNQSGGKIIGLLKEKILEDALEHPHLYSTTRKKNTRSKQIISEYIEK